MTAQPTDPDPIIELRAPIEVAKAANHRASEFKDFGVKEIDPHFDIPPMLMGFRGEDGRAGVLVEVICDDVDRDKGLDAAYLIGALDCAAVCATFDAHMSQTMVNPRTGEEWKRGEMQALCDGESACDTGLLTDCLVTTAVLFDGTNACFTHGYHWHEATREVHWVEKDLNEGVERHEGYIVESMVDALKRAQTRNSLLFDPELHKELGVEMPPAARAYRDIAVLQALAGSVAMVQVAPQIAENAEERAMFEALIAEHKNMHWLSP